MKQTMSLYVDGGCTNSNQKDYALREMVVVVSSEDGTILIEKKQSDGGSNNIAELLAVKEALLWATANEVKDLLLYTDSMVAYWWTMNSEKRIDRKARKKLNNPEYVEALRVTISAAKKMLNNFLILQIPRERNIAGHYIEMRYNL